jgi:cytochrome c oxidase subunit 3
VSERAAVGLELAEQFTTAEQQERAAKLGMWAWLLTELLLFAGMFLVAVVLRMEHPASVHAVVDHLKIWIGAANSVVLILSSLAMTGAIEASRLGRVRPMALFMVTTASLGVVFLCFKSFEYYQDYSEHMMPFLGSAYALAGDRATILFANLYYAATGVHAVHLSIGIALMLTMARIASAPGYLGRHQNRVEIVGLYWHFIDLIWMIAYPALYLVSR